MSRTHLSREKRKIVDNSPSHGWSRDQLKKQFQMEISQKLVTFNMTDKEIPFEADPAFILKKKIQENTLKGEIRYRHRIPLQREFLDLEQVKEIISFQEERDLEYTYQGKIYLHNTNDGTVAVVGPESE